MSQPPELRGAMSAWDAIVEAKIAEAQRAGAFDDLPGAGKPLDLTDDRLDPEDVRVAYRILRNAGCVPAELIERKEAADLRELLATVAAEDPERRRALAKIALLEARLEQRRAARRRRG
jgi:transcriptional accessory protein Tex/SPT6